MRIILAGPDGEALTRAAYPAFAAAGFDVAAVVSTPAELGDVVGALGRDSVLACPPVVVEAELYATPAEAAEALAALAPSRVAVVLPQRWEGEREVFASLPNLAAGFTAPVSWPQVAVVLKMRAVGAQREGGGSGRVARASLRPTPAPLPEPPGLRTNAPPMGEGRVVAFWSGPAGGTGRTTLALALAAYAAERGVDTTLLALSEPALSAYLYLPRVPNATVFFETGGLAAAEQVVAWEGEEGLRVSLRVILGPARPQKGVVERERIGALVEACRASHETVVMDLPPLVPGGNVWALEPLLRATDVALVVAPTTAGVAAAVEGLATLRDLQTANRVHLVLNHRSPGGLPARDFTAAVSRLWGSCPEPVVVAFYLPHLATALDRGELPEEEALEEAVAELAEDALGIPRLRPGTEQGLSEAEHAARPRRRLGRLISVQVVD
ncbi:MAG TPA: hypothetical protein ENI39_07050 [Anaerolineae bacterium]|nr:hypothetical protein [Anaerolineae bacterium]